jgi:hypothetical protein
VEFKLPCENTVPVTIANRRQDVSKRLEIGVEVLTKFPWLTTTNMAGKTEEINCNL